MLTMLIRLDSPDEFEQSCVAGSFIRQAFDTFRLMKRKMGLLLYHVFIICHYLCLFYCYYKSH